MSLRVEIIVQVLGPDFADMLEAEITAASRVRDALKDAGIEAYVAVATSEKRILEG